MLPPLSEFAAAMGRTPPSPLELHASSNHGVSQSKLHTLSESRIICARRLNFEQGISSMKYPILTN
jgi:hypothetical protein